ncbi:MULTISPECIES: YbbR-like domain-containing protein [Clostridium]|uniref:YbbR-like domain-containing protein n=1 Tax=Clostridium faecium TaxID=2762223 RepID=A0ABR8YTH8_9CLOT|nr:MULTISPECIES: CdaR family protein [Clostridium]MBD8047566.1 YbbR-like domain-containing protein [Clostridium faecium]MDU1349934.1 CdaR family protein [Clostridium argentinense]
MDKEKRQDILIKICCIIASFALWFYIRGTENPITSHSIKNIPVQVLNTEALAQNNLVLLPEQNFKVNLNVKGPASAVYHIDKNKDFKIVVDLSKYALKAGVNTIPIEITESPSTVSIVSENLWIEVKIDTIKNKEVPVTPEVQGELSPGAYKEELSVSPAVVKVSGPSKYVDRVQGVVGKIDVTNMDRDVEKAVELTPVDSEGNIVNNVTLSSSTATIRVPIKRGKSVPIRINITGEVPNGATIETMEVTPKNVEILGTSDVVNNIANLSTEPIDLTTITADTTLDVHLEIPEGVRISNDITTVKVKFTLNLKKKSEKTFNIGITQLNVPEKSTVTLDKDTLELALSGYEEDLNKITPETITATLDLKNLNEGDHDVPVVISGIPENVTKVSQNIQTVKVNIKKTTEVINDNVDTSE